MAVLLKIILVFVVFYYLSRFLMRLFFGRLQRKASAFQNEQKANAETKEPETQEERILDYQRKSFESADVDDVDFEEVKH